MRCHELHFGAARRKLFASVVNGRHYEYTKGAAPFKSIVKALVKSSLRAHTTTHTTTLGAHTECISFVASAVLLTRPADAPSLYDGS